jgi:GST-like protein
MIWFGIRLRRFHLTGVQLIRPDLDRFKSGFIRIASLGRAGARHGALTSRRRGAAAHGGIAHVLKPQRGISREKSREWSRFSLCEAHEIANRSGWGNDRADHGRHSAHHDGRCRCKRSPAIPEIFMLKFYFNGSPNPTKVALFLEEAGLAYDPIAVDTRKGDQFKPEYLAVNPNAKVPAIDDDGAIVFDSNAILLYLAEKTGKFLPAASPNALANKTRAELLSWLMFVATGIGPYSGQAVHFRHFAPKEQNHDYAHNRYQYEGHRHLKIVDDHLATRSYMVGDAYSIVDMALWGWARMAPFAFGDDAFTKYPNLKRLVDEISARPAAARALALKDKFTFKADLDEEARGFMFGHLKTKVA